jgi:hypothetical protein
MSMRLDLNQPLNAFSISPDRLHVAVGGREVKIISVGEQHFYPVKQLNTQGKSTTAISDIQWHPQEGIKFI